MKIVYQHSSEYTIGDGNFLFDFIMDAEPTLDANSLRRNIRNCWLASSIGHYGVNDDIYACSAIKLVTPDRVNECLGFVPDVPYGEFGYCVTRRTSYQQGWQKLLWSMHQKNPVVQLMLLYSTVHEQNTASRAMLGSFGFVELRTLKDGIIVYIQEKEGNFRHNAR